jgi:hypothetical protein
MAQEKPKWQRDIAGDKIRYDNAQEQARQEKQELIMLRSEVQQQSQTIDNQKTIIENLTSKNGKCEQQSTQLLEQNKNLRADNTTLRQNNTAIDADNFQLRIAYNELKDLYLENLEKLRILQKSYLENLEKLHLLQNSLTRSQIH